MINELPVSCQFGTTSFTATQTELTRNNDVMGDGILQEHDLSIVAIISDIGNLPEIQQVISVAGTKYHIVERIVDQFNVGVTFVLRRI